MILGLAAIDVAATLVWEAWAVVELAAPPVENANEVAAPSVGEADNVVIESVVELWAADCAEAVDVAAADSVVETLVSLNRLNRAVLPDPIPTAGTDPTSFPVPLLTNGFVDVLLEPVTTLGSPAVEAVEDAASWTVRDDVVSCESRDVFEPPTPTAGTLPLSFPGFVVEAENGFVDVGVREACGAVAACRRCGPNVMGFKEPSTTYRALGLCSCRTTFLFLMEC